MTHNYTPVADTVRGVLDHYAESQPNVQFAYFPETKQSLSYAALRQELHNQIGLFQRHGLQPGDTVSFMMCNGRTSLVLFLAAIYGGYIISPLNPAAGDEQLTYVIEHSDTRAVFVSAEFAEQVTSIVKQLASGIQVHQLDVDTGCPEGLDSTRLYWLP